MITALIRYHYHVRVSLALHCTFHGPRTGVSQSLVGQIQLVVVSFWVLITLCAQESAKER